MSLAQVRSWRDAMRADAAHAPTSGLSRPGMDLALELCLGTWTDAALASLPSGVPFARATVVTARTVPTAALEWLAVLGVHGTAVTWKVPRGVPGLSAWAAAHAVRSGLALTVTEHRDAVRGAQLVVVLGSDATVRAVREAAPHARVLGFGHRFSVAWLDGPASCEALTRDVAAYDTRGCMAPALAFTPDAAAVLAPLTAALDVAHRVVPPGEVAQVEHAERRARDAFAQVVGRVVAGDGWRIHVVPAAHVEPVARVRTVQLVEVPDVAAARAVLAPWTAALSTSGGADLGAPRVCALGELQAPPLVRRHDGVDHLAALTRTG